MEVLNRISRSQTGNKADFWCNTIIDHAIRRDADGRAKRKPTSRDTKTPHPPGNRARIGQDGKIGDKRLCTERMEKRSEKGPLRTRLWAVHGLRKR